jgi:sugar lactone lactonase YvrE
VRLQQQAHAARDRGDKEARLQAVSQLRKLLNDTPTAVGAAAKAYAESGENDLALAELSAFADLDQADDALLAGKDPSFAALEKLPQYQAILKRFAENKTAISRAEMAFSLPDPGLVAEDIDYDRESKTFLITSVLEKKIVRVTMDGRASDFAASPSGWPMLAIKIDAGRGLVWATEVALDSFSAAPKADWGRSAVLSFDLHTGKLRGRIEGPAHSALGDMVLATDGDPIVSDGKGGGVFRVKGGRLERIDGGEFISPQTATLSPDGKQVLIPDYLRGIGVLDLASRKVEWLSGDEGRRFAFDGIDGLYFDHGSLFATQNGTSPERVIRFQLNSTLSGVVSEQVIERATDTLGDPTHGVIVGDYFYYIANSGWSELDDHGVVNAGRKLTAARIMRFGR